MRLPQGSHRSKSTETPGADRELLREDGTNRNLGPSESRPVNEEALRQRYQSEPIPRTSMQMRELSPGQKALADAIAELGGRVLREIVVPIILDIAVPAAKTRFSEFAELRRTRALERAEPEVRTATADGVDSSSPRSSKTHSDIAEVDEAGPVIEMSRSEVMTAQLQLQIAEEYAARQRWLLAHASVTEENSSEELQRIVSAVLEGRVADLSDAERETVAAYIRLASRLASSSHELPPD